MPETYRAGKEAAICAVVFAWAELVARFYGFVHHCLAKTDTTLQMDNLSDTRPSMEADTGNETLAVLKITMDS